MAYQPQIEKQRRCRFPEIRVEKLAEHLRNFEYFWIEEGQDRWRLVVNSENSEHYIDRLNGAFWFDGRAFTTNSIEDAQEQVIKKLLGRPYSC